MSRLHIYDHVKGVVDHVSALSVVAVMAEWLPVAVSALAFIWYLLRFYEYFRCKLKKEEWKP